MKLRRPKKPYRPMDILLCYPFGFRVQVEVRRNHDLFDAEQLTAERKGRETRDKGPSPIHKLARFMKPGWRDKGARVRKPDRLTVHDISELEVLP